MRKLKHTACFWDLFFFIGWCLTLCHTAPINLRFVLKEGDFFCFMGVCLSLSTASLSKDSISNLRSLDMPVSWKSFSFPCKDKWGPFWHQCLAFPTICACLHPSRSESCLHQSFSTPLALALWQTCFAFTLSFHPFLGDQHHHRTPNLWNWLHCLR